MFNMIEKYITNLSKEDVNNFAMKKNINLSANELDFIYTFIKRNYKDMIKNPSLFNIDRYADKFKDDNFTKIKKVYIEYFSKYHNLLK